jgi:hypothetical protein
MRAHFFDRRVNTPTINGPRLDARVPQSTLQLFATRLCALPMNLQFMGQIQGRGTACQATCRAVCVQSGLGILRGTLATRSQAQKRLAEVMREDFQAQALEALALGGIERLQQHLLH